MNYIYYKFCLTNLLLSFCTFFIIACGSPRTNFQNKKIANFTKPNSAKPNIIYILADDLGYGELGAYGQQKIETPHLDRLARMGMTFTNHYSGAPVCAPARYMLMSGLHAGHAYIRGNDEWVDRGEVWNYKAVIQDSTLEGQRPIPTESKLIPYYLRQVGYTPAMIGKWGLGAPHTDAIPTKMGFDYFFGYNCQRQAHTYYPVHLYENEKRFSLANDTLAPSTKLDKDANINHPSSYAKYTSKVYAPTIMHKKMMDYLSLHKSEPFFLYWATPIPHNPIQAPQRWVDYYIKKFGAEEPYIGNKSYYPHQYPRAAYAAMISYLDEQVGDLIQFLKDNDLYDNTLIMFSSDNGVTYTGGTDGAYFNSSGVHGEEYGRAKGYLYEGGIHVPMIASWPGQIKAGSVTDHLSNQYDILATLADITEITLVDKTDGISFLPTLLGKPQRQTHNFLYWEYPEYGGQVAIRMGEWKVVRQNLNDKKKSPTTELYNVKSDPAELINVADQYPDILLRAAAIFKQEHTDAKVEQFRIPLIEGGLYRDN
jgi:arylsulfatase